MSASGTRATFLHESACVPWRDRTIQNLKHCVFKNMLTWHVATRPISNHRNCWEFVTSFSSSSDDGIDCVRSRFFRTLRTLEIQPFKNVDKQVNYMNLVQNSQKFIYFINVNKSQSWFEIEEYCLASVQNLFWRTFCANFQRNRQN